MNVIYVGIVPPQHIIDEIKQLGSYMDNASLTFQKALVTGLDHWFPDMRIVSGIRVDCFPKVKKIYFKPEEYSHKGDVTKRDRFVGIVNLPILKRIFLFLDKRRSIKRMLSKDDQNIIVMYALPSSQLLAVATLRKKIYKSCLVIPDLPEYMSDKRGLLRAFAKSIDRKLINWAIRRIDTFALLSCHMAEKLPIDKKSWRVMEGIYNQKDSDIRPIDDYNHYRTIMYSGDLGLRYGIKDLLDAFELITDKNYRLLICGAGDGKELVQDVATQDSRVIYMGVVDREKVLSLQRSASVLVNPRKKTKEYTKYSFPSKTMEYLASGTPVIMHHLQSIPSEYDDYINYIESETSESLRNKIVDVCEHHYEESLIKAQRAALFIKEKKNAVVQSRIIVELIKSEKS